MKTWKELENIQLQMTYGDLLEIYQEIDGYYRDECKRLMSEGEINQGFHYQHCRHAIARFLKEIKRYGTEGI